MTLLLLRPLGLPPEYTTVQVAGTGLNLGIDIDFENDPLSLTRNWVPVGHHVRHMSIRRGRTRVLDRVEAGVLTLTLSNHNRQFEPDHADSPYYPNVRPMRPVRVYAQSDDGTIHPLFTGFVEAWHMSWPSTGRDSLVVLEAVDIFKLFRQIKGRGSYANRILRNRPVGYWRFGLGANGSTDESGNGNNALVSGGPNVNAVGLLTNDPDGAIAFDGVDDYAYVADAAALDPGDTFALCCWARFGTITGDQSLFYKGTNGYHLYVDHISGGTGRLVLEKVGDGVIVASGTVIVAGEPVFLGAIKDGTANAYAIVNNASYQVDLNASRVIQATTDQLWLGRNPGRYTLGTVDEFAIFNTGTAQLRQTTSASSGTSVLEDMRRWYSAGLQRYHAVQTGPQVADHVCDVGWPLADIYKAEGAHELASGTVLTATASALDHLQTIAQSDNALAFVRANGYVVYQGYDDLFIPTQSYRSKYRADSSGVFGDGGGTEIPYTDVAPLSSDDEVIYNAVSMSAVDTGSDGFTGYLVVDAESTLNYGERPLDVSTLLRADTARSKLLVRAQEELERFKNPKRRIQQLQFAPAGLDTDGQNAVLALDLSDRWTFRRRPVNAAGDVAGTIEFDVFVEGVAHDLDAYGNWRVTVDVSDAA